MPYIKLQEVREQAGFQYKERSEALEDGDGVTWVFNTAHFPIVDSNKSGTPATAADITVYGSGSPWGVTSIVPATGEIVLSSTPGSGTPMTIDYDWSNVGDDLVESYLNEAHSLVLSKLSKVYSLPLSSTPEIIKLIEKKLAAGLLLDKEYSLGGDETEDTRGRRWIKWSQQLLDEIVSGELELVDSGGNVVSQLTGAGIEGYPDETTEDNTEDDSGGEIKFRSKKEF